MREFTEIIDFPEKLHEAYKIKIGRKGQMTTSRKGKDFRPPVKEDHFEIKLNERDANGDLKVAKNIMADLVRYNAERKGLKNIDSKNPDNYKIVTEIPIRLLYDEISSNFSYKYAYHKGRKIICHGNGREAEWHPNMEDRKDIVHKDGQTCKECRYYKAKNCKYSGRLICYLEFMPELGSVAAFRTTGFNSVSYLKTSLKTIKRLGNGILAGLPLILTVSPQEVTFDDSGKDKASTAYVVNIVFRPPPVKLLKGDKKPILEIGTEVAKEAFHIANIRETNKQEWEKMKATAEEIQVAITEEESEEESLVDHEQEFYPENVQEEVEQENQERQQNEEQRKNNLLESAKKRMFAAKKTVKGVNQTIAKVRAKNLKEIEAWYKKLFGDLPEEEVVEEIPDEPPESAAEEAPGDITEPASDPEPEPEPATEPSQKATGAPGEPELPLDDLPDEPGAETEPETEQKHEGVDIPKEDGNLF